MRHPGNDRTPPDLEHAPGPVILADLKLSVVTPMFGGGVEPGHIDEDNLIRPSAIRGHLRFWWRACNAARFTSLDALHEEERALWGSAAKDNDPTTGPAVIGIRVLDIVDGERFTYQLPQRLWRKENDNAHNELGPGYALFPFTPQTNLPPGALDGMVGISFRLQLTVASHAGKRVEWPNHDQCRDAAGQALWAWIAFGGVGSRTRRGCGTLLCEKNGDDLPEDRLGKNQLGADRFKPSGDDVGQWLQTRLSDPTYVAAPVARHITSVSMLAGCRIALGPTAVRLIPAWKAAIQPMQDFLQGEGIRRNRPYQNRNRPGQSYWPEVGAARAILNAPSGNDDFDDAYTKLPLADATGRQFPRADLGLPRLIKVASENSAPVATVERDRVGFTRMASPIILKALSVSTTKAVPIALLLNAPHLWDPGTPGLKLKGPGVPGEHLDPHPLNEPDNRPTWPRTRPRNVSDADVESARDAFMNFVASRNGWGRIR